MAFPTIPTVAANRVLFSNVAGTGTRTFPSLSAPFVHNAGDLLLALIVAYQSSSGQGAPGGAVFSSWGASFTEFMDQMTTNSTTMAIGGAWKIATGAESGTFTVAQAATITGGASMCLMSIPEAYIFAAPEFTTIANGTGAADPGALTPTAGTQDYLWIAVEGNGETNASGAWNGVTSAPTNYVSYADAATPDTSTVGECEIAVAFRQLRTNSENVGAFTGDTSNTRDSAVLLAVRPVSTTQTQNRISATNFQDPGLV